MFKRIPMSRAEAVLASAGEIRQSKLLLTTLGTATRLFLGTGVLRG